MQAHKQIFKYKERMGKEGKGPFNEEQMAGASWFGPEGTDFERLCMARKRKRGGTALAQRGGKGSHEWEKAAQGSRGRSLQASVKDCKIKGVHVDDCKALAKEDAARSQQARKQLKFKARLTNQKPKSKTQRKVHFSRWESPSFIACSFPGAFQRTSRQRRNLPLPQRYKIN